MEIRATVMDKFEEQPIAIVDVETDETKSAQNGYVERFITGKIREMAPAWKEFTDTWFQPFFLVERDGRTYCAVQHLTIDKRYYASKSLLHLEEPDIIRLILWDTFHGTPEEYERIVHEEHRVKPSAN